jgi:phosphopantetheine adenylyltransferase
MKEYIVWLRHRAQSTLRSVRVEADSDYEASCAARATHIEHTVARVYPVSSNEDD